MKIMNNSHLLSRLTVAVSACLLYVESAHAAPLACPTNNVQTVQAGGDIQLAIANAQKGASGGTVFLSAGTYLIAAGHPLMLPSNVSLCSNGDAIVKMGQTQPDFLLHAGDSVANVRASNLSITNIIFDGGVVTLFGDHITVKGNSFRNISQQVGTSSWAAFGAERSNNLVIDSNQFVNLTNGGMSFWETTDTEISNNTLTSIYQGISFRSDTVATSNINIHNNSLDGLVRMGIEIMGADGLNGTGVVVQSNRLTNWTSAAKAPYAMSVVRGVNAVVSNNTAICGVGCANWILPLVDTDPDYPYMVHQPDNRYCDEPSPAGQTTTWKNVRPSTGLEAGGRGTITVGGNTFQGFRDGITIQAPIDAINVTGNAIYGSVNGIGKTQVPPQSTATTIKITGNQIENPRATGIDGEWSVVTNVSITGNLITREGGNWGAADSLCAFRGITTAPQASGSQAMVIDGNRVLIEGATPPSGFTATGIRLHVNSNQSGLLSGTDIRNNWIANTTSAKFGSAFLIDNSGATTGVKLTNNTLQNLAAISTGVVENYFSTASSGNVAFNMTGSTQFAAKTATIPAVSFTPTSATGTGPLTVTFKEANAYLYGTLPTWYLGDGTSISGVTINKTYALPANRTVRMLQPFLAGFTSMSKALITQQ